MWWRVSWLAFPIVALLSLVPVAAQDSKPSVVVTPFADDTGDPECAWVPGTLRDWLSAALAAQECFDVVDAARLEILKREAALAEGGFLDPAQSIQALRSARVDWCVTGRVGGNRQGLTIEARLFKVADGAARAPVLASNVALENVAEAAQGLARELAARFERPSSEGEAIVRAVGPRGPTTALQHYLQARDALEHRQFPTAFEQVLKALEIAPGWTEALTLLCQIEAASGQHERAVANAILGAQAPFLHPEQAKALAAQLRFAEGEAAKKALARCLIMPDATFAFGYEALARGDPEVRALLMQLLDAPETAGASRAARPVLPPTAREEFERKLRAPRPSRRTRAALMLAWVREPAAIDQLVARVVSPISSEQQRRDLVFQDWRGGGTDSEIDFSDRAGDRNHAAAALLGYDEAARANVARTLLDRHALGTDSTTTRLIGGLYRDLLPPFVVIPEWGEFHARNPKAFKGRERAFAEHLSAIVPEYRQARDERIRALLALMKPAAREPLRRPGQDGFDTLPPFRWPIRKPMASSRRLAKIKSEMEELTHVPWLENQTPAREWWAAHRTDDERSLRRQGLLYSFEVARRHEEHETDEAVTHVWISLHEALGAYVGAGIAALAAQPNAPASADRGMLAAPYPCVGDYGCARFLESLHADGGGMMPFQLPDTGNLSERQTMLRRYWQGVKPLKAALIAAWTTDAEEQKTMSAAIDRCVTPDYSRDEQSLDDRLIRWCQATPPLAPGAYERLPRETINYPPAGMRGALARVFRRADMAAHRGRLIKWSLALWEDRDDAPSTDLHADEVRPYLSRGEVCAPGFTLALFSATVQRQAELKREVGDPDVGVRAAAWAELSNLYSRLSRYHGLEDLFPIGVGDSDVGVFNCVLTLLQMTRGNRGEELPWLTIAFHQALAFDRAGTTVDFHPWADLLRPKGEDHNLIGKLLGDFLRLADPGWSEELGPKERRRRIDPLTEALRSSLERLIHGPDAGPFSRAFMVSLLSQWHCARVDRTQWLRWAITLAEPAGTDISARSFALLRRSGVPVTDSLAKRAGNHEGAWIATYGNEESWALLVELYPDPLRDPPPEWLIDAMVTLGDGRLVPLLLGRWRDQGSPDAVQRLRRLSGLDFGDDPAPWEAWLASCVSGPLPAPEQFDQVSEVETTLALETLLVEGRSALPRARRWLEQAGPERASRYFSTVRGPDVLDLLFEWLPRHHPFHYPYVNIVNQSLPIHVVLARCYSPAEIAAAIARCPPQSRALRAEAIRDALCAVEVITHGGFDNNTGPKHGTIDAVRASPYASAWRALSSVAPMSEHRSSLSGVPDDALPEIRARLLVVLEQRRAVDHEVIEMMKLALRGYAPGDEQEYLPYLEAPTNPASRGLAALAMGLSGRSEYAPRLRELRARERSLADETVLTAALFLLGESALRGDLVELLLLQGLTPWTALVMEACAQRRHRDLYQLLVELGADERMSAQQAPFGAFFPYETLLHVADPGVFPYLIDVPLPDRFRRARCLQRLPALPPGAITARGVDRPALKQWWIRQSETLFDRQRQGGHAESLWVTGLTDAEHGTPSSLSLALTELLIARLSGPDGIPLIDRARLSEVQREQARSLVSDTDRALELGRGAGAGFVLAGTVQVRDGQAAVTVWVVEVANSRLLVQSRAQATLSEIETLLGPLADEITRTWRQGGFRRRDMTDEDHPIAADRFLRALAAYYRGDYPEALRWLTDLREWDPHYPELADWERRCWLASGVGSDPTAIVDSASDGVPAADADPAAGATKEPQPADDRRRDAAPSRPSNAGLEQLAAASLDERSRILARLETRGNDAVPEVIAHLKRPDAPCRRELIEFLGSVTKPAALTFLRSQALDTTLPISHRVEALEAALGAFAPGPTARLDVAVRFLHAPDDTLRDVAFRRLIEADNLALPFVVAALSDEVPPASVWEKFPGWIARSQDTQGIPKISAREQPWVQPPDLMIGVLVHRHGPALARLALKEPSGRAFRVICALSMDKQPVPWKIDAMREAFRHPEPAVRGVALRWFDQIPKSMVPLDILASGLLEEKLGLADPARQRAENAPSPPPEEASK